MKDAFSEICLIAVEKDAFVQSLYTIRGDTRTLCWNLGILRDFHDWELEGVNGLMELIYSKQILENQEDCLVWNPDGKWRFSV